MKMVRQFNGPQLRERLRALLSTPDIEGEEHLTPEQQFLFSVLDVCSRGETYTDPWMFARVQARMLELRRERRKGAA